MKTLKGIFESLLQHTIKEKESQYSSFNLYIKNIIQCIDRTIGSAKREAQIEGMLPDDIARTINAATLLYQYYLLELAQLARRKESSCYFLSLENQQSFSEQIASYFQELAPELGAAKSVLEYLKTELENIGDPNLPAYSQSSIAPQFNPKEKEASVYFNTDILSLAESLKQSINTNRVPAVFFVNTQNDGIETGNNIGVFYHRGRVTAYNNRGTCLQYASGLCLPKAIIFSDPEFRQNREKRLNDSSNTAETDIKIEPGEHAVKPSKAQKYSFSFTKGLGVVTFFKLEMQQAKVLGPQPYNLESSVTPSL